MYKRQKQYDETAMIGILAKIKETLFGYLIFQIGIKKSKKNLRLDLINKIYISEVLHIEEYKKDKENRFETIISELETDMRRFLEIIITTDDNPDFLRIGIESRTTFIETQKSNDFEKGLTGEDSLRMYGYFKNITYYNKRFLLPN